MAAGDQSEPDPNTKPHAHTVTELRLALVCYGGVSLAIYMHGVVKELHKLVAASRRFDELGPAAANPFDPATDTEHAYFEALVDLAHEQTLLSVNVDIVAGTSAGGINGVCLAKVLARNGSQDALKRLWIDEGDLTKLLHAPPVLGWRTRAVLAAARILRGLGKPISPLRGDRMSQLLYDAIAAMDAPVDPARRTLLLPETPLDLFVTTTDLQGFPVLVPSGAGGASQRETEHAQVMQFRSSGSDDEFGPTSVGALAFAARATSSFPGAFAPVSAASFADEVAGRPVDVEQIGRRLRRQRGNGTGSPPSGWCVDGGVLDNAPFDLVVQAIGEKSAQTEVLRRLVYVQPDPGQPLTPSASDHTGASSSPEPGYLPALLRSIGTVKGSHSILRELEALRDLNARIAELGAMAELQMHQVQAAIEQAWTTAADTTGTAADPWSIDHPSDVRALADQLYASAPSFTGAGFATYCRLKVEAAGQRLADEVVTRFVYPPGSSRASFVRAAVSAWGWSRVEWRDPDPSRLQKLLGPVDVPYRERRLMFVLAGVNALYAKVDHEPRLRRAELDAMKATAWQLLGQLRAAPGRAVAAVPEPAIAFLGSDLSDEAVFSNPDAFAREHDAHFDQLFSTYRDSLEQQLPDSGAPMWQAFVDHTAGWGADDRRSLVSRFLGFPLWDSLIFPTVALSRLPQFTPITVSQLSPLAAMALTTPDGGKLKGVSLFHFGGFVDAAWRENDYLWGRLDAVELLLRMLRSSRPGQPQRLPDDAAEAADAAGPQLRGALRAVLGAEQDLRRIAALRASLEAEVAALPASAPGPDQAGVVGQAVSST